MSDTIQLRRYTPTQAALMQKRPSDLIQAVESTVDAMSAALMQSAAEFIIQGTTLLTSRLLPKQQAKKAVEHFDVDVMVDVVSADWAKWTTQTKEAFQRAYEAPRQQTSAAARLRVERLSLLQAAFGFTVQDLASVLGITRPQLYKWLDVAIDVKLQESSRVRMAAVERIAKEWMARSVAPLSSVSKEPLEAGGTAFTLMSAEAINDAAVIAAFDELAVKLQGQPKTRSQRLREAGFTRRVSARSLPSDE